MGTGAINSSQLLGVTLPVGECTPEKAPLFHMDLDCSAWCIMDNAFLTDIFFQVSTVDTVDRCRILKKAMDIVLC